MLAVLLLIAHSQNKPSFDFDVRSGHGLTISANGVPVVNGSWIQYYEDGWVKGYYDSQNNSQQIDRLDADTVRVTYSGYGDQATGTIVYHRENDHLKVHYDMHWGGSDPAEVELTAGLLPATVLQAGTLTIDGKPTRDLKTHDYSGSGDFERRRFAPDSTDFLFDAPLARLEAKTSIPTTMFDARGYLQDYAEGRSVWWFGALKLDVAKDKPATFDIDWQLKPAAVADSKTAQIAMTAQETPGAVTADEQLPVIVPKPTIDQMRFDKPLVFTGVYDWPVGLVRFWDTDFVGDLNRRFEMPKPDPKAAHVAVDGGVSKLGMLPGGYQIEIKEHSVSVLGEEDEGLHNGLHALARLMFVKDGKLMLPTGYMRVAPKVKWRGVHLFVGPESLGFQSKLWDRVLLPLGFNEAVLECERTQWDSTPNMRDPRVDMTKADLAKLVAYYKGKGIDPVPLIQSFGHMEWFFEGGQNLDLAINPKTPYTVDPRKPETAQKLNDIWTEACNLFKPTMIHFGCDEVDMEGFPPDHTALTTDLWSKQMPVLKQIADKNSAQMMIWGDQGLAPKEAIDATNGVNKDESAKRRAAIPKGTWIADWHYKDDPMPEHFLPSLQLWKFDKFVPIASTWYSPNDIRSFDIAAAVEHSGTLQTTWAGELSNERSMLDNFNQYSAMILAADYSFSERMDMPDKLGYDPGAVFRRMYYGSRRPVLPKTGTQVFSGAAGSDLVDNGLHFKVGDPIAMRSLVTNPSGPSTLDLAFSAKGSHLALVLDAADRCDNGTPLASLVIETSGGSVTSALTYGWQVRSADDPAACPMADTVQHLNVLELPIPPNVTIKGLKIESLNPQGGVRIFGAIVW